MSPHCHICTSTKTARIRHIDRYEQLRCLICGIVFIHPQPPRKKVFENNNDRYDSEETLRTYKTMEGKFFKRAQQCADILKKGQTFSQKRSDLSGNKKLLDVGCSNGQYLKIFRDCGYEGYGIDISPHAVRYATEHYRLAAEVTSLDDFRAKNGPFDVITLFDVIEHLHDPVDSLKKLHKLLKPGGILVLQTPNYDSLIQRMTGIRWYWLLVPHHLFLFSERSMEIFLRRDFDILHLQTWDDMYEFWSNILTILGLSNTGKYPRLHRRIVRVLQLITTPLSWAWSTYGYGGELVVYARRK